MSARNGRATSPCDCANGGLALPKLQRRGGLSSIELAQDDVQPLNLPKGAPLRFHYGRMIELSDFASWSAPASLLAPLFAKAAEIAPADPLNAEVAKIRTASTNPAVRATAALALVQDRIRYVALLLNNGGLVPATAGTTWSRRFGDCKGKTVLLLAMLHGLGIEAEPVLVSARAGDGLDQRLPLVAAFDHVLVRARIAGVTYWLDGTRTGDRRLDKIAVPAFAWGLPLSPGAALVAMLPPPFAEPHTDIAIRLDATKGLTLPAPAHIDYVMRGDLAAGTNLELANLTGERRDQALKAWWKEQFEFIEPKTMTTAYDADARVLTLVMDGTAKLEWNDGYYEADKVGVGYLADFARDAGPDRDAPYAVNYPHYFRARETIMLPPGNRFTIYKNVPDIDQTVAGVAYKRHAAIVGNSFTVEETERAVAPEFAAADAPAAQAKLRELAKQTLYVTRPNNYRQTDGEVTATMAGTPANTQEYLDRGNLLLDRRRFAEATSDFTKALALTPGNAWALADRAIAETGLNDLAAAQRDIDAASAVEPNNAVVWRARGLLATVKKDTAGEIAAYSKALELEPGDAFALSRRAAAYRVAGKDDLALADAAAELSKFPSDVDSYLLRANILLLKGDTAGVVREAAAVAAANPDNDYALVVASRILAAVDHRAEAMAMLDRALKLGPKAEIYLNRANVRPRTAYDERAGDIAAALKLDSKNLEAFAMLAGLQRERGDFKGAIATINTVLAVNPDATWAKLQRGIAHAKAGDAAAASKDFAAVRATAATATALNTLCSERATAGVDLTGALADCDAALVLIPEAAQILDSRGFVLLRLGRLAEAAATYDRAIKLRPTQAQSLYGRALAATGLGDTATADRDTALALKTAPGVIAEFEGYGVTAKPARPPGVVPQSEKPSI